MNTVERFTNRVANYAKYRPGYPREIIDFLSGEIGLTAKSIVADLGSGTGFSARLFLENGNTVYGVEPNAWMRAAAEEYLAGFSAFHSVDGTAEATTLPDASIDLVMAAQAFHWFDRGKAGAEARRIARTDAFLLLIWNERQLDSTPFLRDYEALLRRFANDYDAVRHDNVASDELQSFFGKDFRQATFQNRQLFDLAGLRGRLLSSSYMPTEDDPRFNEMSEALAELFAKHREGGKIAVLYDTNIFFAQV